MASAKCVKLFFAVSMLTSLISISLGLAQSRNEYYGSGPDTDYPENGATAYFLEEPMNVTTR